MKPSALDGAYISSLSASGGALFLRYATDVNGTALSRGCKPVRSDDHGATWVRFPADLCLPGAKCGPDLFIVNNASVWRVAADGTQDTISAGLPDSASISLFTCNDELFACPEDRGVFRLDSDKSGWIEANAGLTNRSVRCMIGKNGALFAGTAGGVFYSINGRTDWIALNSGFENDSTATSLAAGSDHLFALIDRSVWRMPLAGITAGTARENLRAACAPFAVSRSGPCLSFDFSIPRAEYVAIGIFDLAGREISVITRGRLGAGIHHVIRKFPDLTPGCYMIRMQTAGSGITKKVPLFR
jgi:hypothetical protein